MQKAAIYNEKVVLETKREFAFSLVLILAFLVCLIGEAIGLCFLLDDASFLWINILLSFSAIILVWGIIYVSTSHLAPTSARKKLMKRLEKGDEVEIVGVVVSCQKERTPLKFLPCLLIEIQTEEGMKGIYFEQALGNPPFQVGDKVDVLVKMNFLYEVKEVSHG